ncbi:DgyrCDS9924 [Dimorphilus gyrociliatus]|uniref:DgyrCDS9924 n=1 Tax=Dimorphilus gyrociliatus TaxID=2664684 RepID=A0A7I8W0N8_9ANNE|nr:DgyrCDS9924 [Dimorphilus gyrociliatus]
MSLRMVIKTVFKKILRFYSNIIVKFWIGILILTVVLVVACGVPTFLTQKLPDFTEPTKGFETRGTKIKRAIISEENIDTGGLTRPSFNRIKRTVVGPEPPNENSNSNTDLNRCYTIYSDLSYFYPKMCWKAKDDSDLFTLSNLKKLCRVGYKYFLNVGTFSTLCEVQSLPVYIANMKGLRTCEEITQNDIEDVHEMLKTCAPFYYNQQLTISCRESRNCLESLPSACRNNSKHIYNIFYYFVDKDFLRDQKSENLKLKITLLIGTSGNGDHFEYYKEYAEGKQEYENLELAGLKLNGDARQEIFNKYMLEDILFIGIGLGVILLLVILYLKSFVLMIAIIFQISFSFVFAYFFYHIVFRIKFFPFMNLLGVIILVAVGTDDVFVFYDVYLQEVKFLRGQTFSCRTGKEIKKDETKDPDNKKSDDNCEDDCATKEKEENENKETFEENVNNQSIKNSNRDLISNEDSLGDLPTSLEIDEVIYNTFKHAISSISITSFTTAAAFYASVVSDITSIKCFGIFCGTAILCNLFFMVTWIPAVVMAITVISRMLSNRIPKCNKLMKSTEGISKKLSSLNKLIFCKTLPKLVVKLRYVWIIFFTLLGISGFIVTFVTPKLKLPTSETFQLLKMDQPIEAWVHKYKLRFQYAIKKDESRSKNGMPLTMIFGVNDKDNGNHLNPDDKGELSLRSINLFSADMQKTYSKMCEKFKQVEFLSSRTKNICDIVLKDLRTQWSQPCAVGQNCCDLVGPIYPDNKFEYCLTKAIYFGGSYNSMILEPLGYSNSKDILAIRMQLELNQSWTSNYDDMDKLYKSIEAFWSENVGDRGWFTSYFDFYDLQRSLSQGTYVSLGISIGFAFAVMLFTTLNLLITFYAILSIGFAIFTTIGMLVLAGWELNILESVAISLAVGLSIDFPIHYGVSYVLSSCPSRQSKVAESFRRVGSSVAMAALTTIIAGISVLPSRAYSYFQLGLFLVLVMIASWLYATFLFQSLCAAFGPEGSFLQLLSIWKK